MKRLHDYLDYNNVIVKTIEGRKCSGVPIVVDYADESCSGEDEITIENKNGLFGFKESEIESIEVLDKIED